MRVVNLDSAFQPFSGGVGINAINFPSGCEPHVKLMEIGVEEVLITTRINRSDEFLRMLLATDALRRSGTKKVHLFLPYLPFARQDRVMVPGEPLSVKVIADIINAQNYATVTIFDPHSDVGPALLNNVRCISNHTFIDNILNSSSAFGDYYLVSPDAGAYKKIFKVAEHIGYKGEIIMCNKVRNLNNGHLNSVTVSHSNLEGKPCVIIDDICDGGGTFNLLADELKTRNAGPIYLMVSHGIFSKGLGAISPHITKIFTTDSFRNYFDKEPSKEPTYPASFEQINKGHMNRLQVSELKSFVHINH